MSKDSWALGNAGLSFIVLLRDGSSLEFDTLFDLTQLQKFRDLFWSDVSIYSCNIYNEIETPRNMEFHSWIN